ncbi:phospholipid/cholesterol/gamma-HCH transport system substrate-binding protein [Amycolatopsis marina]|uniref:Phospholipid/cholesterol/gamma-HCH transport system substrate-binding protein n=1 Tax=Amycolatopsis marina TaxID=490629 RepID=A0A1I1AJI2_9PSEU|nr:MCE family protein [Amycolatopsis marina]SFB38185.1 phospholipid/cholesterol/gamma-HCH transport system substrate-binding protein [Amycolatopsis marina]
MNRIRWTATATVSVLLLATAGCGEGGFSGLYNTPLPGGADLGAHPYRITAQFTDVLDLVPQSHVKVNDVPIGRVDRVELAPDTKYAIVTMTLNGDVPLPANADAELRQSSLLGEKFVELRSASGDQAQGRLDEGAVIPLARTSRNAEVEEVLGALSLLLNGGGVEQLRTIVHELNAALSGNEAEIRALLSHVDEIATELDGQKGEIIRAIDGLNRLSSTLVEQTGNLTVALDDLAPGLQVVTEQRDQLVGMLQALDRLSGVAVDTVNQSREQLVANLKALEPTLRKLAEAGQNLPTALKILPTYPLPHVAGAVFKGDYANVRARLDLNLDSIFRNLTDSSQPALPIPGLGAAGDSGTDAQDQQDQNGTSAPAESPEPALPLPLSAPTGAQNGSGVLGGLLGTLLGGG